MDKVVTVIPDSLWREFYAVGSTHNYDIDHSYIFAQRLELGSTHIMASLQRYIDAFVS